jgi:hypothetical protein
MQPEMRPTLVALYDHLGRDSGRLPFDSETGRYERRKFSCVAHDDRTPSATVRYGHAEWYHCWSCGLDANAIGVIMAALECSDREAYAWAQANVEGFTNDGCRSPAYQVSRERAFESPWHNDD